MDLTKFPRGARSAKLCTLEMLKTDGTVPTMNLFRQKRTKGWWPFYAKSENDDLLLQVLNPTAINTFLLRYCYIKFN